MKSYKGQVFNAEKGNAIYLYLNLQQKENDNVWDLYECTYR